MKKTFTKIIPVIGLLLVGGALGACSSNEHRSHRGPSVSGDRHYVYRAAPRDYSSRTYNSRRTDSAGYNRYGGSRDRYRASSTLSSGTVTYTTPVVTPRSHRFIRY